MLNQKMNMYSQAFFIYFFPGMFDKDRSGTIDMHEFQQLYNYINQWLSTFRTYDRDNSGHIEEAELNQGNFQIYCSPLCVFVPFRYTFLCSF